MEIELEDVVPLKEVVATEPYPTVIVVVPRPAHPDKYVRSRDENEDFDDLGRALKKGKMIKSASMLKNHFQGGPFRIPHLVQPWSGGTRLRLLLSF